MPHPHHNFSGKREYASAAALKQQRSPPNFALQCSSAFAPTIASGYKGLTWNLSISPRKEPANVYRRHIEAKS
jgi:hypothetical protein